MFTKEYIELCKDKRVQELRPELERGDWYELHGLIFLLANLHGSRQKITWLPTGDQLDEEIIKIADKHNAEYGAIRLKAKKWRVFYGCYVRTENFEHDNPLIAKIKLLLQLLNTK